MDEKRALKQLKFMRDNSSEIRLAAEDWKNHFEILISTVMSARTRDEVTISTAEKLFKFYPTAKSLGKAKIKDVQEIIRPVNFYRNKSKNVVACAKIIHKKYDDKVPLTMEELIELPGVGRKTANVFISEIGEHGLAVDAHVGFWAQKLNWTKNRNPHKIEEDLKKLFSKKNWSKVNAIVVRFGKSHMSRKKKDELLEEIKKIR